MRFLLAGCPQVHATAEPHRRHRHRSYQAHPWRNHHHRRHHHRALPHCDQEGRERHRGSPSCRACPASFWPASFGRLPNEAGSSRRAPTDSANEGCAVRCRCLRRCPERRWCLGPRGVPSFPSSPLPAPHWRLVPHAFPCLAPRSQSYAQAALILDACKLATEFLAPKGMFITKVSPLKAATGTLPRPPPTPAPTTRRPPAAPARHRAPQRWSSPRAALRPSPPGFPLPGVPRAALRLPAAL